MRTITMASLLPAAVRGVLAAFLAACVLPLAAAQVPTAAERPANDGYRDRLQAVRALYGAGGWTASARREGLPLADATFPGYQGEAVYQVDGRLERRFVSADGLPPFVVEAQVFDQARGAHGLLVEWLAGRTPLQPAPAAREFEWLIGDEAYVGLSGARPGALAWIAFVRGNVAVGVLATDPTATPQPDLHAIAVALDQSILAQPVVKPGLPVPQPAVRVFASERGELLAGESTVLTLDVAGELAAVEWVFAAGQGYVEADAAGRYRLHATGSGAMKLGAVLVGRRGVTTRTDLLEIAVADR